MASLDPKQCLESSATSQDQKSTLLHFALYKTNGKSLTQHLKNRSKLILSPKSFAIGPVSSPNAKSINWMRTSNNQLRNQRKGERRPTKALRDGFRLWMRGTANNRRKFIIVLGHQSTTQTLTER